MSGYWTRDELVRVPRADVWRWVPCPWWRSGWFIVALEVAGLLAIAAWGWLAP